MNVNGIFPQAQCFRGKGFGHLIRKQMENSRNSVLKKRHALDDVFEKQQNDIDKSDEGLNKKVSFGESMLFEQYFSNEEDYIRTRDYTYGKNPTEEEIQYLTALIKKHDKNTEKIFNEILASLPFPEEAILHDPPDPIVDNIPIPMLNHYNPDYVDACLTNERYQAIVKKLILKVIEEEKNEMDKNIQKEINLAYTKQILSKNILSDFNENKKIPNAILIQGEDKESRQEIIKWIIGSTNSNYTFIPYKNESNDLKFNQILTALEEAQENYKTSKQPTLMWIENFHELLQEKEENEEIIANLKELLCSLGSNYKTMIIFEAKDTKNLSPLALQPHRINKIINLDKKISLNDFDNLMKDFVRANFTSITGGYRLPHISPEKGYVDLYLGDCGKDSAILWIDTTDADKINYVSENIDIVKEKSWFKNIKKMQYPRPDNMKELRLNSRFVSKYTAEGIPIYESIL